MRTRASKEAARRERAQGRREKLPQGLRGLEAILAVELPDEGTRPRNSSNWNKIRKRIGARSAEDDEDARWRAVERAYLEGRVPTGVPMRLNELLQLIGIKPVGDLMCLQMRLAEHRSPAKLVEECCGRYRMETR
jgi:hypothetical protein